MDRTIESSLPPWGQRAREFEYKKRKEKWIIKYRKEKWESDCDDLVPGIESTPPVSFLFSHDVASELRTFCPPFFSFFFFFFLFLFFFSFFELSHTTPDRRQHTSERMKGRIDMLGFLCTLLLRWRDGHVTRLTSYHVKWILKSRDNKSDVITWPSGRAGLLQAKNLIRPKNTHAHTNSKSHTYAHTYAYTQKHIWYTQLRISPSFLFSHEKYNLSIDVRCMLSTTLITDAPLIVYTTKLAE